jgi:hypothetical protein
MAKKVVPTEKQKTDSGKLSKSPVQSKQESILKVHPPKEIAIWIAAIIFVITTSVFFWGQLTGKTFFWEDFTEYVYPVQTFSAVESAHGVIPFWNPYSFAGMPFYADIQVGFFYPFNRILNFFVTSDGKLPVGALQFIIILHFFIAQFTMFLLCRSWKISSHGSLIAALTYAFSFALVFHVIHPMIIYHLAWFPLVLMFYYKAMTGSTIKNAIVAGLIFGMSMLSGHPQMTLYEALFLGIFFLWYIIAGFKKKEIIGKQVPKFLICSILPFVIAVGIFAIQYLPSKELAAQSQRSEMTYEKASEGSMANKQIVTSIVPKAFGFIDGAEDRSAPYMLQINDPQTNETKPAPYYHYWDTAFYFGITGLLLGLIAAIALYKQRKVAFLIVMALFGIEFAVGSNGFIYPIFYNFPLFNNFRNPSRIIFYFVLVISLLSGMGFDYLWNNLKRKEVISKILIAGTIILFISILVTAGVWLSGNEITDQIKNQIQSFGITSLIFVFVVLVLLWLLYRGIVKPSLAGAILIVLVFIDLYIAGVSFNSSKVSSDKFYQLEPEMKKQLTPHPPDDLFRVNMRMYQPRSFQAMQRNQGLIDRIMLIEGYNPLILQRVLPPLKTRDEVNAIYNVKDEIGIDSAKKRYAFIERQSYFPRAWLVHKVNIIAENEVHTKMKSGNYDLRNEVIIEEKLSVSLPQVIDTSIKETVRCIEYKSNELKYKINAVKSGILCFSEIWYPAWKAYVDGKETKIFRADYCFRAIEIPEGEHTIEMKYQSETFKSGMYITLFTLLGSIVSFFVFDRKKKNNAG